MHTPDPTNGPLKGVGYFYLIKLGLQAYSEDICRYFNNKLHRRTCINPPFVLRKGGTLQYRNKKACFQAEFFYKNPNGCLAN